MHSGRRIQQHLDTNSGFQFDVIIGDNIEFAIPDCCFATTPTAPLSTDPTKTGSLKQRSRKAKHRALQISRCAVAQDRIGPTTRLFRSRTSAWTTRSWASAASASHKKLVRRCVVDKRFTARSCPICDKFAMAEQRPEPPKAIIAQNLQQQYQELCQLRAELAKLEAIVTKSDRRTSK
jgi:hypothetical protein